MASNEEDVKYEDTSLETDEDDYVENFTTINIETPELKFVMNNCELSGIGNCTTNGTM